MPMTEEEVKLWYDKFPQEILKHTKPSPETIKLFQTMQQQINKIEITTAEQGKDISYIKDTLDKFIARADDCYAGKYVEKKVETVENKLENFTSSGNNKIWEVLKFAINLLIALGVSYVALQLNAR